MIEFHNTEHKHRTVGELEGDELIFRCPACRNYERRVNLKTGQMKCTGNDLPADWEQMTAFEQLMWAESQPQHFGYFTPPGLNVPGGYTPN